MAQIHFTREPFATAWLGIEPLVKAHWDEVKYKGAVLAMPDLKVYAAACAANRLATFTVRRDGVIIGYATFWIHPFPQEGGRIGAWQDAVYLDPKARQGANGAAFLAWCDEQLAAVGATVVFHSVREGRDFSPVLIRNGYQEIERVFSKELTKKAEAKHG